MGDDENGDNQMDMATYMANQAMYGNEQSAYTGQRAAYGNMPMYGMQGAMNVGVGAYQGMGNMMGTIGAHINPVAYSPPPRMNVGYYGESQQNTSFFGGMAAVAGYSDTPRGVYAMEYQRRQVSDFTERAAGGLAGAGLMGASLGAMALANRIPSWKSGVSALEAGGEAIGTKAFGALGGAAGKMAVGFGIYSVGTAAATEVLDQVQNRRELDSYLESSSFRYVGSGSRMADPHTGAGMNRRAREESTDFLRQMDLGDRTIDSADVKTILGESSRLGLMSGVQDVEQFKTRFKELTEGVKTVTKVFETTIADGLKIIKDFKNIGVDPSRVREVSALAQTTALATGRTTQEALGIGMQGAEVFRGTGVDMGIGFASNLMNLSAVRSARDSKLISQQAIAQAGGEEALAQSMTVGGLQFAQSAVGRGAMAAYRTPADLQASLSGGSSLVNMMETASGNLDTVAKQIRYGANQHKHISEIGASFGGTGLQMAEYDEVLKEARMMKDAMGADGANVSTEEMIRYIQQGRGKSEAQIDAFIATPKNAANNYRGQMEALNATRNKEIYQASEENFVLYRAGSQVRDMVGSAADIVARPISSWIGQVKEDVVTGVQSATHGYRSADISQTPYAEVALAAANITTSKKSVRDLDVGGVLSKTVGETLTQSIMEGDAAQFGLTDLLTHTADKARPGDIILDHRGGGVDVRITEDKLTKLRQETAISARITPARATQMAAAGLLDKVTGAGGAPITRESITTAVLTGQLSPTATVDEMARVLGGVGSVRELSDQQYARIASQTENIPGLHQSFIAATKLGATAEGTDPAIAVDIMLNSLDVINKSADRINPGSRSTGLGDEGLSIRTGHGKNDVFTPPAALGFIAAAHQYQMEGKPEQAKAARMQAQKLMEDAPENKGLTVSTRQRDIGSRIRSVEVDPENAQMMRDVLIAHKSIADASENLGAGRITQALISSVATGKDLAGGDAANIQSVIGMLGKNDAEGLVGTSAAVRTSLKKTEAGYNLASELDRMDSIKKIGSSPEFEKAVGYDSQKRFEAALGAGMNDEKKKLLSTAFVGAGGGAAGTTAAIKEELRIFNAEAAGEKIGTGGGNGGAKGEATIEGSLQLQMNTNQTILNALTTVAQAMGKM
jgi:hypothetical protein